MFLNSLRISFMQKKSEKSIARFSRKKEEERDRERERERERQTERDRDGPDYKGPPDAIAKPSDQKLMLSVKNLQKLDFC